jgi:hypothetical protein
MGYLVEGLELFIRKVAYTKCDATVLVRWSNYTWGRRLQLCEWCLEIGNHLLGLTT